VRTTLTIDDDVAMQLERLRRSCDVSLKELINDALRPSLRELNASSKRKKPFQTRRSMSARPSSITWTTSRTSSPSWKASTPGRLIMRTTLTIDDDVAAQLERLRRARDASLKDLINEALRRGLKEMGARPKKSEPFRTRAFDMGPPLINIDNVAEAIAHAEGEGFK
jgi:hypothetical protein